MHTGDPLAGLKMVNRRGKCAVGVGRVGLDAIAGLNLNVSVGSASNRRIR